MTEARKGDIIHFRNKYYRVVTRSLVTKQVKLAPVKRKSGRYEFVLDGEPRWFSLEEVRNYARFVASFS